MSGKKEILGMFPHSEDRLLAARVADLALLAEKRHRPMFCGFLDLREQGVFQLTLSALGEKNGALFGGFSEAERQMGGIAMDKQPEEKEFPITALRIDIPSFRELTHRDYLGTAMSLGITRDKIGDIVVDEQGATLFVAADLADFLCENMQKVGGLGVKPKLLSDLPEVETTQKTEEIRGSIASSRLDCVVAELVRVSRTKADELLAASRVKVMGREETNRSRMIEEGEIIAIRGIGKFKIVSLSGRTKKGNIVLIANRYV